MKVILTDGTVLTTTIVLGAPKHVHGANRDTLTFVFAGASLDELDAHFTEANCETITVVGDDNSKALYTGYTIRAKLTKQLEKTQVATADTEAVYESRVHVVMAQRTYAETKLKENTDVLAALLSE